MGKSRKKRKHEDEEACTPNMIHVCNELRRSTQKIALLRTNKQISDILEGISQIAMPLPSQLILKNLIQVNSDFDWSAVKSEWEENYRMRYKESE